MSDYGANTSDFRSDFRAKLSDYAGDFCDYPGNYGRPPSPGGEARTAATDTTARRSVCAAAPGSCGDLAPICPADTVTTTRPAQWLQATRGKGAKQRTATGAQIGIAERVTWAAI